jgi:hypothetical protein
MTDSKTPPGAPPPASVGVTTSNQPGAAAAPAAVPTVEKKQEEEKNEETSDSWPPALLAHFPRFRWKDPKPDPETDAVLGKPFPADLRPHYAADLAVLNEHLLPQYVAEELDASRAQNEYRRDQVVLIIGGIIATGLAAAPGELTGAGWKVAAAIAASFLAIWAGRSRDLNSQERWRTSRLKAELLKSEYFLFLGRAEPYDKDGCRIRNLRRRVAEIRSGGAA